MDYYDKKKFAYNLVDELINKGESIELIHFKVSTKFGFGKKFVTDRVNQLRCISANIQTLE